MKKTVTSLYPAMKYPFDVSLSMYLIRREYVPAVNEGGLISKATVTVGELKSSLVRMLFKTYWNEENPTMKSEEASEVETFSKRIISSAVYALDSER